MRNRYKKYNNAITNTITEALQELSVSKELSIWFTENGMVTNAENSTSFSALLKTTKLKSMDLLLKYYTVKTFTRDDQLKFYFHIEKLHALTRVTSYMDLSQKQILMNAFFYSQFDYSPWI